MASFTLDTNCIIAIANSEATAPAIRTLVEAHKTEKANVAVVAISASERQSGGGVIKNFDEFRARLRDLGLGHLEILKPIMYWDMTFWDWCLWADDGMQALERKIHEILFPSVEFLWQDYRRSCGIDPNTGSDPSGRWRNCEDSRAASPPRSCCRKAPPPPMRRHPGGKGQRMRGSA